MPIELKPCPFCGKKATLSKRLLVNDEYFTVRCEHDGCIFVSTGMHPTKEGAIEAWNRRDDDATD